MEKLTSEALGRVSLQQYKTMRKRPLYVVLDNVRSLNNVGSVFRSCDAFAVRKLYLCGHHRAPSPPGHPAYGRSGRPRVWSGSILKIRSMR